MNEYLFKIACGVMLGQVYWLPMKKCMTHGETVRVCEGKSEKFHKALSVRCTTVNRITAEEEKEVETGGKNCR